MNCPRDHSVLTRNIKQRVFGYGCNECGGVFLSGDGMKAFKTNFNTEVLETSVTKSTKQESELACPHCFETMKMVNIDDVEIDFCKHCSGVWFDENKAIHIIEKYNPNSDTGPQSIFNLLLDIAIYIPLLLGILYSIFIKIA
jgi:Zn-finger nucleic acid-binding protein